MVVTGMANPQADGRQRRAGRERLPLARRCWLTGVAAALCLFATAASATTFLLETGESFDGEVIHATRNTLMIREAIGAIRQLSLGDVQSVEITTRDGDTISGALLGWREGVYEVGSGDLQIQLQDGERVGEIEEASEIEGAGEIEEVSEIEETGAKPPLLVVAHAEAVEGAKEMVFKIDLSAPASRSIFLVYGTFDRTATAGEDYRKERGSLELAAGDSTAVLRILLIDDDVAESDETFEVFVSADQELATIEQNRVVGTILNDDE